MIDTQNMAHPEQAYFSVGSGQARHSPPSPDLTLLVKQAIEKNEPAHVYKLVSVLARVPTAECAEYKAQLKEHFGRRLNMAELEKAIRETRKAQKRAVLNARKATEQGRPTVEVGGQLRDVVQASLGALYQADKDTPTIFVQSGRLVTIHFTEKKGPVIAPLVESSLRYRLTLAADFVSVRSTADDIIPIAVDPPLDVVRILLNGMNPIDYPFSPLAGITELPILRPDGSIHATPGYDPVTEQVYIPGNLEIPPIPERPGQEDVTSALALLNYWLAGFPFENPASKATALAVAITIVIRSIINGEVPLTLLDAPKQGSGKTILAQAIGMVGTGRRVSPNAPTNDEAEWEKLILTWLQMSPAIILIDNVMHRLESSALSTVLTSPSHQGRELGSNTSLDVPNRAVWFASGNNIRVGPDTARRCIKCRLDARMERPHARNEFQIAGGVNGFFRWTAEHRAELVAAILTLARNWFAQGKPVPDVTPLGNFEEWTTIVGGILQTSGIPSFLANLDSEDGSSSLDEESREWGAFVEAIYAIKGAEPFTCSTLAKDMLGEDDAARNLQEALPISLTKHYDNYRKSQGQASEFAQHMGNAFRTRKGQIYGKWCLETAPEKARANKQQWRIASIDAPPDERKQLYQAAKTLLDTVPLETSFDLPGVDGNVLTLNRNELGTYLVRSLQRKDPRYLEWAKTVLAQLQESIPIPVNQAS